MLVHQISPSDFVPNYSDIYKIAPVTGNPSGLSLVKRSMQIEQKQQQGNMNQMSNEKKMKDQPMQVPAGQNVKKDKKKEKKKRIEAQLKKAAEMRAMDKHNNNKVYTYIPGLYILGVTCTNES